MKIVILDGYALNKGVADSWSRFSEFGEWVMYEETPEDKLEERAKDADIIVINKALIGAALLEKLPKLKLIAVTAAGTNVVDVKAAGERGIAVCNTPAYGTDAVAQHVFALLLELCRHTALHNESVRRGDWRRCKDFCYWLTPQIELTGKTLGIFGFGDLGRRVGEIGHAFRMRVIACAHRPTPKPGYEPFEFVSREELFRRSDVLSLHCPLTAETKGLVCAETLSLMKPGSIIVNTSRGPVVSGRDVAAALKQGRLAGFAADVLEEEPPMDDDPLFSAPNTLFTPHIAWATSGAMSNIVDITVENIRCFLAGKPQNVVNAALLKATAH